MANGTCGTQYYDVYSYTTLYYKNSRTVVAILAAAIKPTTYQHWFSGTYHWFRLCCLKYYNLPPINFALVLSPTLKRLTWLL